MYMSCMAGPSGEEKPMATTSTGYCFSDTSSTGNQNIQTHLLQSFQPPPEIYNLTAGDIIGFQSAKNLHQQNTDDHQQNSVLWKGFFTKPGNYHHAAACGGAGPSSSKDINEPTSNHEFYQHDVAAISETTNETMMVSPDSYHHHQQNRSINVHVDDPSMRVAVFPCEGNERPSQGLSLSLSSSNPSSIGLQSFELRQQQQHDHHDNDHLIRFGPSSSSRSSSHAMMNIQQMQIRSSRYLGPAQELLNEFCNIGTKQQIDKNSKMKVHKDQWQDENAIKKQSLYSLDILELQRKKTKLLQMLEEVDRRYKHYCDQMKSVVSSFEAVAGNGAATVYSALASRAMSRHFRCLRDGIVSQIKETKKAMGEKDSAAPGTVKGETPRLRLLDQTLRQQKALQQMSMMETHPWRPQRGLPERSVSVLRAWLFEHFLHPYPSDVDKHILARQTGLSRSQVSNWFINARVRLWKPMVEEMYLEELKENEAIDGGDENDHGLQINHNRPMNEDQKPTHDQLVRIDSECLSSIINNPEKNDPKNSKTLQNNEQHNHSFGRVGGSYGAMELDFSSYNHHASGGGAATIYGGGGGGGGVSLTLGLHQHGGSGGVSLAFSPSSQQSSLFYPRSEIEECQTVQYSLLDSENQNLPYRNLMGAQLLHDLAG